MKILVTGGAGFIGSNLVERLIENGHDVVVLDDLSSGKESNVPASCRFIKGSITNPADLGNAMEGIEFCFHLAAIPSVEKSTKDWLACHEVNSTGTIGVFLKAAKQNVPVIFASTAAVYGDAQDFPIRENAPIDCISPYGADKFASELQARAFGKVYGMKSLGFRLFNVYGPRQDPSSPYSGVISIFMNKIANNESPTVFGDGMQERDFINVRDVVEILVMSMEDVSVDAKIYNICTGKSTTLLNLISVLSDVTGNSPETKFQAPKIGDIMKSVGDSSLAARNLGFNPRVELKDGLEELLKS